MNSNLTCLCISHQEHKDIISWKKVTCRLMFPRYVFLISNLVCVFNSEVSIHSFFFYSKQIQSSGLFLQAEWTIRDTAVSSVNWENCLSPFFLRDNMSGAVRSNRSLWTGIGQCVLRPIRTLMSCFFFSADRLGNCTRLQVCTEEEVVKQQDLVSQKSDPHAHGTYLSHPHLPGSGFIYFISIFQWIVVTHNQIYNFVNHLTPSSSVLQADVNLCLDPIMTHKLIFKQKGVIGRRKHGLLPKP